MHKIFTISIVATTAVLLLFAVSFLPEEALEGGGAVIVALAIVAILLLAWKFATSQRRALDELARGDVRSFLRSTLLRKKR